MELKFTLGQTPLYHEAVGQVVLRVREVFRQQSGRTQCFAVVGGGKELEVFLFERQGTGTAFSSVTRTGLQPFALAADSPGLRWLASLLFTSPAQLGHKFVPPRSRYDAGLAAG
jgi:hypothetical protein